MSEEEEGPESGTGGAAATGVGVDPFAAAMALGGAGRDEADAFLREQRALAEKQSSLIDIQKHHLHEQFGPQLRQLHLGVWEKRLGVLLRIATAFTGLAVAAGLAYLIWNAAASNDLVIDSFQVPPDLAAKGLSGPVVAAELSDRIAALQAQTLSARAAKSYANGLNEGLKLEIPETGVSLSELDRFLRAKLGHDLHIGGEIVQQDKGTIALTARVGTDGSATVTGAETDMDGLLERLAGQVYRTSQPYRFAIWLQTHDRTEEAVEVLKTLAASGPAGERAWAYNGWAVIVLQRDGERASLSLLQRGHALDPDNYLLIANLGAAELRQGRVENANTYYRTALAALSAHAQDYTTPDGISGQMHNYNAVLLAQRGALLEAAAEQRAGRTNGPNSVRAFAFLAQFLAPLHEPAAARAALAEYSPAGGLANSATELAALQTRLLIAAETQDWSAPALERDFAALTARFPGYSEEKATLLDPFLALALAHNGQFAAAEARLNPMPGDCYPCLRARAQVAALQGQDGRADYWFARAAAAAPSSPYAEAEWGRAFLDRKQPDAAIEKSKLANQKGPHFADPLEMWGEALMAKNQSHLALAKFAEAEKYAPNWGRLHLKWGEALIYVGKKDEAKAQFAHAAALDLTSSEKSELTTITLGMTAHVSEESETGESEAKPANAGADPAAMALALGRSGALDRQAAEYLRKQGRLADLQHEVLANCEAFEVSHLRWRRFGDQMKGMLQIMGVLAGLCVVAGFGVMVWNAAHADGTVIESFTVPPDMAQRGLSGEVVAGQLLDRLGVIQTPPANSVNAAQTLSTSAANDVKVEIPDTGISIGELYRFLRKWLGHETMVGGDVVRAAEGVTVTVRVNGKDGASYAGPEAGLDALVQKAAEHVFEVTRPTAYAAYLMTPQISRLAEAQVVDERVTADPAATPLLRASAWNGLALLYGSRKADVRTGALLFRRAREADPTYAIGYSNQAGDEIELGHPEIALALLPEAMAVFERNHQTFTPLATIDLRTRLHADDARLRGDYAQAVDQEKLAAAALGGGQRQYAALVFAARDMAWQHDGGARAWLAQQPQPPFSPLAPITRNRLLVLFLIEAALEHWQAVIAMEEPTEKAMVKLNSGADLRLYSATQLRPWLALAKAKTGDIAGAQSLIATTPGDCYDCVRLRGTIAAEAKQWDRADWWFAKAVHDAPSIPMAYADWGQALLARGKPDAAIAQFTIAQQKGPHYADASEGWGEALMAKNQSHLALAKFAEAEKYAPNWGRLHLKWGEALVYAGKKEEARAQYHKASTLDLSAADAAALARDMRS